MTTTILHFRLVFASEVLVTSSTMLHNSGMWKRFRSRIVCVIQAFGVVGILASWLAIAAFLDPSVRPHFLHLLYREWLSFAAFKATNLTGFISNDIVQPILLLLFFVVLLHESHGGEAVKIHWGKEGIIGLKAIGLLVVFYYIPIFLWKGVRLVYEEHTALVTENRELRAQNKNLADRLKDAQTNAEEKCERAKDSEIGKLKVRLNQACYLPDRHFTERQKDELFHLLKRLKDAAPKSANVVVCHELPGDMDTLNFAGELQAEFRDSGWSSIGCDGSLLKALLGNSLYRGLVVTSEKQSYDFMASQISAKLLAMGVDVSSLFRPLPDNAPHNTVVVLVGYKVGYVNVPSPF